MTSYLLKTHIRVISIKNKINILCQSILKEQKGYKDKRLLIFPHTGMGDQLTVMGAIRQLSLEHDEIKIVVLKQFVDSVKGFEPTR